MQDCKPSPRRDSQLISGATMISSGIEYALACCHHSVPPKMKGTHMQADDVSATCLQTTHLGTKSLEAAIKSNSTTLSALPSMSTIWPGSGRAGCSQLTSAVGQHVLHTCILHSLAVLLSIKSWLAPASVSEVFTNHTSATSSCRGLLQLPNQAQPHSGHTGLMLATGGTLQVHFQLLVLPS